MKETLSRNCCNVFQKLLFDSYEKNKHFRKWLGDHSVNWNNNDVCPTKSKTRKNWGEFQKRSARSLNKCWEINLLLRTWARVRITIVVSRYTTNITTRNRNTDWFDYFGNSFTTSQPDTQWKWSSHILFTLKMRQHFFVKCVYYLVTKQSARNMVFEFVAESECYHYHWSSSTDQQIIFTPQLLPFSILPSFLPGSSFTTL